MVWISLALASTRVRLDANQKVWVDEQLCGDLSLSHDYLTPPCTMPEGEVVIDANGTADGVYLAVAWLHGAAQVALQTSSGLIFYNSRLSATTVQSRPPLMVKLLPGRELLVERGSARVVLPAPKKEPDWTQLEELLRLDRSLQPESYFVIGVPRALSARYLLDLAALGKKVGFESFVLVDSPAAPPSSDSLIPLPQPGQAFAWPKVSYSQGSLPADVVKSTIAAAFPALNQCYQSGLASQPDLKGTLSITLMIGSSGQVQQATVTNSTLTGAHASGVHQCIERELSALSFPSSAATISVTYPLIFSPS